MDILLFVSGTHQLPIARTDFIVHCTGLDAYEGDTVYLWRYGADRMTGDRDYGKAPLDFAIIRNGEVSFPEKKIRCISMEWSIPAV